jgi:hypothetical protein
VQDYRGYNLAALEQKRFSSNNLEEEINQRNKTKQKKKTIFLFNNSTRFEFTKITVRDTIFF